MHNNALVAGNNVLFRGRLGCAHTHFACLTSCAASDRIIEPTTADNVQRIRTEAALLTEMSLVKIRNSIEADIKHESVSTVISEEYRSVRNKCNNKFVLDRCDFACVIAQNVHTVR